MFKLYKAQAVSTTMQIFSSKTVPILELQTAKRIIFHINKGLNSEVPKVEILILIYFINILSYYLLHVGYD